MLKKTRVKLFGRLRDIEDQVMLNRDLLNDVHDTINKFVADAMMENNRLRTIIDTQNDTIARLMQRCKTQQSIIDSQNEKLGLPKHEPKKRKQQQEGQRDEDNYGHKMPEE